MPIAGVVLGDDQRGGISAGIINLSRCRDRRILLRAFVARYCTHLRGYRTRFDFISFPFFFFFRLERSHKPVRIPVVEALTL